jgi:hypothetical protein
VSRCRVIKKSGACILNAELLLPCAILPTRLSDSYQPNIFFCPIDSGTARKAPGLSSQTPRVAFMSRDPFSTRSHADGMTS